MKNKYLAIVYDNDAAPFGRPDFQRHTIKYTTKKEAKEKGFLLAKRYKINNPQVIIHAS